METRYYEKEGQNLKFTKDFYDLPYHEKVKVILPLLEPDPMNRPSITYITMERIVRALLQHSSKNMKDTCPVQGVRKLSKVAQEADETYNQALAYERNDIG